MRAKPREGRGQPGVNPSTSPPPDAFEFPGTWRDWEKEHAEYRKRVVRQPSSFSSDY